MILQFIHISHLSKSLGFIPSLRGFRGAKTTFSDSDLVRDNVLFDMPVSLLALSLYLDSASVMSSSSRTFDITFAATRVLYRVVWLAIEWHSYQSFSTCTYNQEKYVQ